MRALILILATWLTLAAWAQSSLPPCPPMTFRHNCSGEDRSGGHVYTGEFRNGAPDGQGIYSWPLGERYVGGYKQGARDGFGSYRRRDGSVYVGQWKNDNPDGEGIEYRADGSMARAGRWVNSNFVAPVALDKSRFPFPSGDALADPAAAAPAPTPSAAASGPLPAQAQASDRRPPEPERRPGAPSTERRVALVVGNGAYANSPLANPANDAADMSAALRGLGFEVTTLRDATLRQMREATRRFEDQALGADVALIFFAGHGIEARGRNFMVPTDADIAREFELEDQAYDAGQWLAMLEGARGRNAQRVNIVILDACRDNPLSRQWRSAARGLGRMDAPSGTLLVYSTAPGKVAADGPQGQRNSPFTKSLLQAMQRPDLPVEQVLKEVRRQVMSDTRGEQVPWENSSLVGDFVFKRGP